MTAEKRKPNIALFNGNMNLEFEVSAMIAATPERVYSAWPNSNGHTSITGDTTRVSVVMEEPFEAWGGYIQGRNLEMEPCERILQ